MPELRKDPIVGRWVIISTDRGRRPTDFIAPTIRKKGGFCPFCYGNEDKTPNEIMAFRDNGTQPNTPGWKIRTVPNKFPALEIEGELDRLGEGMFDKMNGIGAHEVVIETSDHSKYIPDLPDKSVEDILWAYIQRILDLRKDNRFKYILIFKNHGLSAGASLEHPHSQIIALPIIPKIVKEEIEGAKLHFKYKERCIFCDVIRQERSSRKRLIIENQDFLAICPFAPRFPFETWILPKNHISAFEDTKKPQIESLAPFLKDVLKRLNKSLDNPAYNLIIHTAPTNKQHSEYFHWHIEIIPKLMKIAGFEWGSGFYINPTPPEEAATYLREVSI